MKKQITLNGWDYLAMWAFVIILLSLIWVNQQDNMTDYKGGQSECTTAYLNE